MKIIHVLNNSAAICSSNTSKSVVVVGKGIAFNKKEGDEIDKTRIDKIYADSSKKIINLIQQIPDEYFEMSTVTIRFAERKLGVPLSSDAYFILSDHINGIMYRYKNNISIPFGFLQQAELFYRDEYQVAEWVLDYLDAALNVELPENEIGFLTIDFVNLVGKNNGMGRLKAIVDIVHLVEEEVDEKYPSIDKSSFSYKRFETHLQYYGFRFISNKEYTDHEIALRFDSNFMNETSDLLKKINNKLEEKYNHSMDVIEQKYLLLHLQRLIYSSH